MNVCFFCLSFRFMFKLYPVTGLKNFASAVSFLISFCFTMFQSRLPYKTIATNLILQNSKTFRNYMFKRALNCPTCILKPLQMTTCVIHTAHHIQELLFRFFLISGTVLRSHHVKCSSRSPYHFLLKTFKNRVLLFSRISTFSNIDPSVSPQDTAAAISPPSHCP